MTNDIINYFAISGLADLIQLKGNERNKVEASKDKTRELIGIWCRRPNVTIGDLMNALVAIDRHDVREDVLEMVLADCVQVNRDCSASISIDVNLLTTSRALTIQVSKKNTSEKLHSWLIFAKMSVKTRDRRLTSSQKQVQT